MYEANKFQVLDQLLVAWVSDLWNHFCRVSLYSFHFIYGFTEMWRPKLDCKFQVGSDKGLVEWEHEFCALVVEVEGNES